ncbi:MAG: tRNA threonylcarbamoyladenosine dehydratase [Clostridia bacterium]|nr:tRNA threonylcarbamoyladenosine dehydratase [Clostridia bacterium]
MSHQFARTELLLGDINKLKNCRVAVFGIGGVGGHAVEALVRCGVGEIDIIDNDTVSLTNLNRQIFALHSTLGRPKVEVAKERLCDINPDVKINSHNLFFTPDTEFDFSQFDYVIDAIDTVTSKIALVELCQKAGVPIISSMGTGNKLDPTKFEVTDIYKTSVCPLARVMRCELKKRGVKRLKVVYSKEEPIKPTESDEDKGVRRSIPGSVSFVPSVAGLILAGEVIKDLIRNS